jgi:hypothetical protein
MGSVKPLGEGKVDDFDVRYTWMSEEDLEQVFVV